MFHTLTEVYEVLFPPGSRLAVEGPFLAGALPKGGCALDLACGTGAHAHYLAARGVTVTACDLSAEMISLAKAKREHPNVCYRQADMREPPSGEFDLIYCIGNSLNLLPDRGAVLKTLQQSATRLRSGGRLVLHCVNPTGPSRDEAPLVRAASTNRGEIEACREWRPAGQSRELHLSFTVRCAATGECLASGRECHKILDLDRADLTTVTAEAGLRELACYGSFAGDEFDASESRDIVWMGE